MNDRALADRLTVGLVPVPVKLTVCGLPIPESAILRVAVRLPAATGVKTTLTAQFAPAASVPEHVVVSEKSDELAPVIVIPVKVREVSPLFVTVTD